MTTVETRYTPEDLLNMPDAERYELVRGRLVERAMGARAAAIAGEVFYLLKSFLKENPIGHVLPDPTSYQCYPDEPGKVRRPDCSFVGRGRLPNDEIPEGNVLVPPDLAVEVTSPSDRYADVETKVFEYLDAGVRMVWVVNPETRTVRVYTPGTRGIALLREDDELDGGEVLPGFKVAVADLFRLAR